MSQEFVFSLWVGDYCLFPGFMPEVDMPVPTICLPVTDTPTPGPNDPSHEDPSLLTPPASPVYTVTMMEGHPHALFRCVPVNQRRDWEEEDEGEDEMEEEKEEAEEMEGIEGDREDVDDEDKVEEDDHGRDYDHDPHAKVEEGDNEGNGGKFWP